MAKRSRRPPPPPSSESDSSSEGSPSSSDEEQPTRTQSTPKLTEDKEDAEADEEDAEADEQSADNEGEGEGKKAGKKPLAAASTLSTKPPSEPAGSGTDSESDSNTESATRSGSKPSKKRKAKPMSAAACNRNKGKHMAENEEKAAFQRIWTLDDEIVLLTGLAEFQSENRPVKLCNTAIRGFHDTIKTKLSLKEATTSQLVDKLRSLKKKFLCISARKECGKLPRTDHDRAIYDLGNKIWAVCDASAGIFSDDGETNNGGGSSKENAWSSKEKFSFLKGAVESLKEALGEMLVSELLEMLDVTKAAALDKKLKKLAVEKMKLEAHKQDLLKETLKLVIETVERATS